MHRKQFSLGWSVALAIFAVVLVLETVALAGTEKVLYRFTGGNDGANPQAGLIFDSSGNLYGTTPYGGGAGCSYGCGTVFELTPNSSGGWTESVLYSFCSATNCTDGAEPFWNTGLTLDSVGNLYGTAGGGGANGGGVVFELSPNSGGGWTESVLYNFCSLTNCADGRQPDGSVTFDSAGNLYGTTWSGACKECGVVFQLSPSGTGGWTESVLYSFQPGIPQGRLVFDQQGNLYGSTNWDRQNGISGSVYKLSPNGGGQWEFRSLHSFGSYGNGGGPSIMINSAGNIYGAVPYTNIVFELKRKPSGGWSESTIFAFGKRSSPWGPLAFDVAGNLYGTCDSGGSRRKGTVFELKPPDKGGKWSLTTLYSFKGGKDGAVPFSGVVLDSVGNLYGTTFEAGGTGGCSYDDGCGIVFEITP